MTVFLLLYRQFSWDINSYKYTDSLKFIQMNIQYNRLTAYDNRNKNKWKWMNVKVSISNSSSVWKILISYHFENL